MNLRKRIVRTSGFSAMMLGALLLGACATGSGSSEADTPSRTGSDRGAKGCIPSAGYQWCTRLERCVRPWELARENGFENTREAFADFCGTPLESSSSQH